jgi:hypothetical protein
MIRVVYHTVVDELSNLEFLTLHQEGSFNTSTAGYGGALVGAAVVEEGPVQ